MTSDSLGCNDLFLRVDLCCFDENNHFLTEIEAGSTEKFLVIRFSVYENDAPDVISHENQLQHLCEPSIFILDVFRTADHAGQIFIPHRLYNFFIIRPIDSKGTTGGGNHPICEVGLRAVSQLPVRYINVCLSIRLMSSTSCRRGSSSIASAHTSSPRPTHLLSDHHGLRFSVGRYELCHRDWVECSDVLVLMRTSSTATTIERS